MKNIVCGNADAFELSDWKLQPITKQCKFGPVRTFRPDTKIPATFQVDLDDTVNYTHPETGTNTLWTNSNNLSR